MQMLERSRTGGEHARGAAYIGAFKVWKHHQACKMLQVSLLHAHDEVCAIAPWFFMEIATMREQDV